MKLKIITGDNQKTVEKEFESFSEDQKIKVIRTESSAAFMSWNNSESRGTKLFHTIYIYYTVIYVSNVDHDMPTRI